MGTDSQVALIAIFGATGTGKTTFVNDASGGDLRVGHHSHACTKDVDQSPAFQVDGRNVVLFDTPGFDDTHLSDTEILKRISGFLAVSYKEGYKLTGIIYLHRITDIRVGGISRRTFNVFRKLCGKDSLSNVLLVTNMWSDPPTPQQIERETELCTNVDFFQPAIEQGASMVRRTHKDRRSAHDIIRMLLPKDPVAMRIQEELVDEGKDLSDTGAGREIEHELLMAAEKHKAEMAELLSDMEEALRDRDERTQRELAQYQREARLSEQERQAELADLRQGHGQEARWQRQVEKARADQKAAEARQDALYERLEAERKEQAQASEQRRREMQGRIDALYDRLETQRKERAQASEKQRRGMQECIDALYDRLEAERKEQAQASEQQRREMQERIDTLYDRLETERREQAQASEQQRREMQERIDALQNVVWI